MINARVKPKQLLAYFDVTRGYEEQLHLAEGIHRVVWKIGGGYLKEALK